MRIRRLLPTVGAIVLIAASVAAQQKHTIYIEPTDDGFETYLAAAMQKKGVPVSIVTNPDLASLTLKAALVKVDKETTGSKVVRCLFAYCAGIEDKASTSVQLIRNDGSVVEWSYSVNKGRGNKNRQSLAEAIAKHLKDE